MIERLSSVRKAVQASQSVQEELSEFLPSALAATPVVMMPRAHEQSIFSLQHLLCIVHVLEMGIVASLDNIPPSTPKSDRAPLKGRMSGPSKPKDNAAVYTTCDMVGRVAYKFSYIAV